MQRNWSPFNFISREFLAAIDQYSLLDEPVKSASHVMGKAAAGTSAAKSPIVSSHIPRQTRLQRRKGKGSLLLRPERSARQRGLSLLKTPKGKAQTFSLHLPILRMLGVSGYLFSAPSSPKSRKVFAPSNSNKFSHAHTIQTADKIFS